MTYDLKAAKAPRMAGIALSSAAELLENPVAKSLLEARLLEDTGVSAFRRRMLAEAPSVAPLVPRGRAPDPHAAAPVLDLPAPVERAGYSLETSDRLVARYRDGSLDPVSVAEKVLAAIEASNASKPPLRAIIATHAWEVQSAAAASRERYRRSEPLSPLDGVPVAVKDELDQRGLPTRVGTRFLGRAPATADATVVARLRAAGALLIGKANMHEIGIDTSGYNQHHGTPRNPYAPESYTGGSSSGSAAAVAAGLCPIAIGADGGGSIRIPAALCGVVGLKPTWGRVSEHGAFPLCWSVGHVGPMAASARDAALAYAVMAGADPADANTLGQPAPTLSGFAEGVRGLRLGVYRPWFDDASPEVLEVARAMLAALERDGAELVEVELPELELGRVAHAVTILSEMATAMDAHEDHRREHQPGVRIMLAIARTLTNRDYVRAQQARTRVTATFERGLARVDAIVTPTTGIAAPPIRPDALARGESDLEVTSALMRFVFPSNLTGHPAISFPAGHTASGAPVGLQAIGRFWDEALLLRIAAAAEAHLDRHPPTIHHRLT